MFFGYPRSGHSLVGSIIDAHPAAVVANEYNLLDRLRKSAIASPAATESARSSARKAQVAGLLANSRGCAGRRVQAGYNYTVGGDAWQGRWRLPLRVIGDKKGGDTARQVAFDHNGSLAALRAFRGPDGAANFRFKFLRVIRNPWDQMASSFARNYFWTHPELFRGSAGADGRVAFSTSAFRATSKTIDFRGEGRYEGASSELKRPGSPARNLVGRALSFFALHAATERVRRGVTSGGGGGGSGGGGGERGRGETEGGDDGWASIGADWHDVYTDHLQGSPTTEIERLCEFLGLDRPTDHVARTVGLVSTVPSAPSRYFRWPRNFVAAVRECLRLDPALARFADADVPVGEPFLTDLAGWGQAGKCVFDPASADDMFAAHCRSRARPLHSCGRAG